MTVKPRHSAPPLEVKLLDGSAWRLSDAKPAAFEMIVVYRGLHCPVCEGYLGGSRPSCLNSPSGALTLLP